VSAEQTLYQLATRFNVPIEDINQKVIDEAVIASEPIEPVCPYSGCRMPCNCAAEANNEG